MLLFKWYGVYFLFYFLHWQKNNVKDALNDEKNKNCLYNWPSNR